MRAPAGAIEHSGHIFSRAGISPQCGFMEVGEWVLTGFGRQRQQVCSVGWPRRLVRKFSDDVVGLAVERVKAE